MNHELIGFLDKEPTNINNHYYKEVRTMRTRGKNQITFLTLILIVAIPFASYARDGQVKIGQTASTTFPIQITQSGSYVLTSDISVSTTNVNGIEINTDNVTLDLNGHVMVGPGKTSGTSGHGIYANDTRNNIAVINGTVRAFREGGITLIGTNNQVKDIRAYNNGLVGISANNSIITNCTANNNDNTGIFGGYSTITNCTTNNNESGIYVIGSVVSNCLASTNTTAGIACQYSTITTCQSLSNGADGISSSSIGGSRIEGNNVITNGGYGIRLSGNNNYVIKNSVGNNTTGNLQDNGSGNYMPICGVDVTDNCNYGF